ncbi:GNAT family N-acetyltransferase [Candidatus Gracilibacteria bacterium]|nr:GNAT family N-acetyltransferase [Candidatus Gracilibacteria bacterium]
MIEKIKIKILSGKAKKEYEKELLRLYDNENKRVREYKKSFLNSNFIVIALLENKIVGAVRIISDMFMCALIIDLLVDPGFRGKGIGNKIMKETVKLCINKKIKNIELIADPSFNWLPNFYEKVGFQNSPENGVYMSLNKSLIQKLGKKQ